MSDDKTTPDHQSPLLQASDATARDTTPDPKRWWALAAIALGVSLIIMDATVVNVALPVVIRDLSLSATEAEWMNAVYSLMFAALLTSGAVVGSSSSVWSSSWGPRCLPGRR